MLFSAIMSGDLRRLMISLFLGLPAVVICLSVHEASHGLAAYLMGDRTAQAAGRLTLDPLAHIDPWGFVCMLLLGFGWARPVPVNISQFRNRRVGMGVTAAAGPLSNFILSFLSYFIVILMAHFFSPTSGVVETLTTFFLYIGSMSAGLGVFNLLPVHPLDGSRILDSILPFKMQVRYQNFMKRYGSVVLLVVIFFVWYGGLSVLLSSAQGIVFHWAELLARLVIG